MSIQAKFLIITLGGLAAAVEVTATCHLCVSILAPDWQKEDPYILLLFVAVLVGAVLGTALAAVVVRLDGTLEGVIVGLCGCGVATVLGLPASWFAVMIVSFSPPSLAAVAIAAQYAVLFLFCWLIGKQVRTQG